MTAKKQKVRIMAKGRMGLLLCLSMSNAMKPMFVLSFLALFGFLLLLGGCAPQNDWARQPGAGDPEIQAILRDVACRYKIVGLSAGIVRPASDTDLAVVGWIKAGNETPIGLNNLWHLGSCSKAMTTTLAAKLVEEERLHWHTTLAEVFPELAQELDQVKRGITLEQLLSHRSGLPLSPRKWPAQKAEDATRQCLVIVHQVPRAELVGLPGARFSYSNFGYILAGAMIEKITGEQFKDVIRARLFVPLDMPSQEYEGTHVYGEGGVIWSHRPSGRPVPRRRMPFNDHPSLRPAGSVRCNLDDWARFIRHHLIGEMGGSDYLQAETYRELHRSRGDNYALGWAVLQRDWGDGTVLQHAGSNGWNYSVVWIAPQKGFAVFVCANQGKCDEAIDEVANRLIDLATN